MAFSVIPISLVWFTIGFFSGCLFCFFNKKRKNKQKKKDDHIMSAVPMSSNPWADDLHEDIMTLIIQKLGFVDQLRFRAVCRRWRQKHMRLLASQPKRPPWEFKGNWILHKCNESCFLGEREPFKLFDPIDRRTYTVSSHGMHFTNAWASKEGWLLLSDQKSGSLIFYSPFFRKKIKLPKLDSPPDHVTCTSPPTSSNCMVFAICYNFFSKIFTISKCHAGDKTWITTSFQSDSPEIIKYAVYFEGSLYCVSCLSNSIEALNFSENIWTMIAGPELKYYHSVHLVESCGELLLVCVIDLPDIDYDEPGQSIIWRGKDGSWDIHIFKLVEGTHWVRVESLGNRALFINWSRTSTISISIEVSSTTSTTEAIVADGIYLNDSLHLRFYPLKKNGESYVSKIYTKYDPKARYLIQGYIEVPLLHY